MSQISLIHYPVNAKMLIKHFLLIGVIGFAR